MKDDFKKAVEKADLYAEQAMVVTLGFGNRNIAEDEKQAPQPAEISAAFLQYLHDEKVPHAVIHQSAYNLTIALAREELAPEGEAGEKNARAVVAGFFKDEKKSALKSEAYYQKAAPHAGLKNKLLASVSPLRREVAKNIARINGK